MLNFTVMPLDAEHLDAYCADIVSQVRDGVATMPLFKMTLVPEGDPVIDKAELFCRVYERYKERLDTCGIPSGVLIQASIGHGWQLDAPSPFQRYIGLSGAENPNVHCPMDEGFRRYIRGAAARIAATHPAHIMLDDDFRLMERPQRGCACPLHLAALERRCGVTFTREALYDALCEGDAYREHFIATQLDSLIDCAREIRRGIDAVDPTIPGSYCTCGRRAEGAYEIAAAMVGANNPVTVRVNNSNYCVSEPRKLMHVMHRFASQRAAMTKKADVLLAETDTWPQNRYSTSASMLHVHFTLSILEGACGAKHWITRLNSFEPRSGAAYRAQLARYAGFYEALAALYPRLRFVGCRIPVPSRPYYKLTERDDPPKSPGWQHCVLGRFGLPVHYSDEGEGATFLDGNADLLYTDAELSALLASRVVLDGVAAQRVTARGFAHCLGVEVRGRERSAPVVSGEEILPHGHTAVMPGLRELHPCKDGVRIYGNAYHLAQGVRREPLFPTVTSYRNALGGQCAVFAGDSCFALSLGSGAFGFLNESRKAQLVRVLRDMDALPVYYPGDAELLMKAAHVEGGGMLCMLVNLGMDPLDEVPLVLTRPVGRVRALRCDGSLCVTEFEQEGEQVLIRTPLAPYTPLVLLLDA